MAEIFTVRGGIYDVGALSAAQVADLYRAELARAGFTAPQLPVVLQVPTRATATTDGVFKQLAIEAPPFDATSQTRDTRAAYADDPAKLAEAGRAQLTSFAWNLCGPSDGAGALRDLFRRVRLEGTIKLSPLVSTWSAAPIDVPGYPRRPAQVSCTPRASGAGPALGLLALLGFLGVALRKGG